jgi:hypothetical protein
MPQKGWVMKLALGIIDAHFTGFRPTNKLEGFIFPGE